jgi:hypothetical protein
MVHLLDESMPARRLRLYGLVDRVHVSVPCVADSIGLVAATGRYAEDRKEATLPRHPAHPPRASDRESRAAWPSHIGGKETAVG